MCEGGEAKLSASRVRPEYPCAYGNGYLRPMTYDEFMRAHQRPGEKNASPSKKEDADVDPKKTDWSLYDALVDSVCGSDLRPKQAAAGRPLCKDDIARFARARESHHETRRLTRQRSGSEPLDMKPVNSWEGAILE